MRHNRNTVIAISSACVVLGVACSSDDSSDGVTGREQPLEETGGASGAAGAAPAGAPGNVAATDGADVDPDTALGAAAGGASPGALPGALPDAGASPSVFFLQQVSDDGSGPVSHLAAVPASAIGELEGADVTALGLSVPGDNPAAVFGTSVFLASSDEPTLSRFDLGPDGRLVAGPSLSFGELGVLDVFYWRNIVASDTKAYLFDSENERVIAYNPRSMELTGVEIDISASTKPGFTLDPLAYYGRVVNGTLFAPASWYSEDAFASLGTAALYAIDVASDELLAFGEDTRCPGYILAALPSGDLHVLPDNLFAEELGLGVDAPACSLRVAAGSVGFDPDFARDLGALVAAGGAPRFVQGGGVDGSGGIYLGAAAPPAPDAGAAEGELAYDLLRWDVAGGTATPVSDLTITGALVEHSNGAPPSFVLQPAADLASTRVLELSASPPRAATLSGNIVAFAKLQ